MRVRLRYFASIREALGRREDELDVAAGSTVDAVWARLVAEQPALAVQRYRPAVNQAYVDAGTVLQEGDEVVFIPPVSGGASPPLPAQAPDRADPAGWLCRITREPIEIPELIAAVQTAADGAVCLFSGVVREDSRQRTVRYLEYDAYPEMAERQMRQILEEVRRKWPQQQAAIVHRIGRLEIGEASVVIAVASPHRGESFEACRYVIDRVKQEVPIWKKEVFSDGEAWVEGS
ncbi:MAG TPA: molybdopterin converting factor subunit 1 [Chloroflexota bacterium]|nr:molybdopterin converting factor subunit 1 [Chloroflexota bacterium]